MFPISLGPFDLMTPIGKGGMGEVWKGVHRGQDIPVAVKVMTGARARQRKYRDAFLNEVRAVAALDHPGVVMIFDCGTVTVEAEEASSRRLVARSPYLVMELASRGSLDQLRGIIPWRDLKRFIISLLDALAHAHARGVIHRDLKPGNVLLAADRDLRPGIKLTDFGLAHAREESDSRISESKAGTPRYMAPELFEGNWRDYGPWTDLYALGCMVYEMCSNKPLFDGQDFHTLKRQHFYQPPPPLEPLQPIPEGLEQWLLRLVEKKPYDRFQCAADAAWALMSLEFDNDAISSSSAFFEYEPQKTSMMSEMSGLGQVSTFFFPDNSWSLGSSTFLHNDGSLHKAGTHLLRQRGVSDASTYLFPDYDVVRARTHLFNPTSQTRRSDTFNAVERAVTSCKPMERRPAIMPPTWRHATPPSPSMQLVGAGLRLFGLRSLRMVGREKIREQLWDSLEQVRASGEARLALFHGPAGVGKSRMAHWLCRRAVEVGAATVLRSVHSPMSGPTDGLSRMVARFLEVGGLRRPDIRRRTRRLLQEMGVTDAYEWDALTEMIAGDASSGLVVARAKPIRFANPTERYVLIRRLIERMGRDRPVVIWCDDVQWGSDTIAFVDYLLRNQVLSPTPVLILMTARDEYLAERSLENSMLETVAELPNTEQFAIKPLDPNEMSDLVEDLLGLSPDLARLVESRTQGNPLFAVQLVGDWVSRGVLEVTEAGFVLVDGEHANLPDDLYQVWASRIERLLEDEEPDAQYALELAAVLGQEVDALEWEGVCKEAGVWLSFHLLYKLISARLAIPFDDIWTFAHGMLRESLERNAQENGRSQEHHRACASMLIRRYPSLPKGIAERLGRHLIAAGDYAAALKPLLQGARELLEVCEYRIAQSLLELHSEALVRLGLPENDSSHGLGWVTELELLCREGHMAEALEVAVKTEKLAKAHEWSGVLPRALEFLGRIYLQMGELEPAKSSFLKSLKLHGDNTTPLALTGIIDCNRGLGLVASRRGELSRATELLHHALVKSQQHGDRRRVAENLQATSQVVLLRGELELATDLNQQALDLFAKVGHGHGVAECRRSEAAIAVIQGKLDRGTDIYEEAMQLFERLGAIYGITTCLNGLAEIALQRKWFDTARDGYNRVLFLQEASGHDTILIQIKLGWVLFEEGKLESARTTFENGKQVTNASGMKTNYAVILAHLIACDAANSDWLNWWEQIRELKALLEETQIIRADIATPLQRAATIASSQQQKREAMTAYKMARQIWEVLGRGDQMAIIDTSLSIIGR